MMMPNWFKEKPGHGRYSLNKLDMILQFNSLALDKRYQTDSELPFEYCYALRLPLYSNSPSL